MRTEIAIHRWPIVFAALALLFGAHRASAQGTAFTYQGRLNDGGQPANGSYDFRFRLATDPLASNYVGGNALTNGVQITNGLFTALLDFGANFPGSNRWLEVDVRTNGAGSYTVLLPLQALTPAPYAVFANTASNLTGTFPAAQLSGTPNAAVNFTGNLNGDVTGTQGATLVSAVGGQTASNVAAGVNAANAATSANTVNTIVKRDVGGNFSAGSVTLNGTLNLPGTPVTINSGGSSLLRADSLFNFFAGPGAGNLTMSGFNNTAVGLNALGQNTTGAQNTATGDGALTGNTSGNYNTADGHSALDFNTSGSGNTAEGYGALNFNTIGNNNTAIGYGSLQNTVNGNNNITIGYNAGSSLTYGNNNIEIGNTGQVGDASVIRLGTPGTHTNMFLAGNVNLNGTLNLPAAPVTINFGGNLLLRVDSTGNFFAGPNAGNLTMTGYNNTAIGEGALEGNITGVQNTAIGDGALTSNTAGTGNTADGYIALSFNTSGNYNTATGLGALAFNTNGSYNTADGYTALYSNTSGTNNTAIGWDALYKNTSGGNNTAIGFGALESCTNGNYNIAIGFNAGTSLNTGNNNIEIGNSVGLAVENGVLRIGTQGTQTSAFIAGISGATASGGVPVYVNFTGQLGTLTSSARFKDDIRNMDDASAALLLLRPVKFRYKPGIDPKGTPQFGLVAEEVDKVNPDLVVRDDKNQIYTVRYEAVNAMLLNEFLKEHRKVEDQSAEIETLKARLERLEQLVMSKNGGVK